MHPKRLKKSLSKFGLDAYGLSKRYVFFRLGVCQRSADRAENSGADLAVSRLKP